MAELDDIRDVTPPRRPALGDEARAEAEALAVRQRRAGGILMQVILFAGGQVEDALSVLPEATRTQLTGAVRAALRQAYDVARASHGIGPSGRGANRALATVSGAAGGLGGLPTALAELPVATTLIFRAIQEVAARHGYDPADEATALEILQVFGRGGPGEGDDGVDLGFVGARLSLTGAAVNRLIAAVAPRFAAVLGQKLAAQSVPVLGALAGAGTNYAFLRYYTELAEVHFGLRALADAHGEAEVLDAFHAALARGRAPVRRG